MKKEKTPKTLSDYPARLRGLSNNRWGGHSCGHLRGFRGNTYGAASPCRKFTIEERAAWAQEHGYDAKL